MERDVYLYMYRNCIKHKKKYLQNVPSHWFVVRVVVYGTYPDREFEISCTFFIVYFHPPPVSNWKIFILSTFENWSFQNLTKSTRINELTRRYGLLREPSALSLINSFTEITHHLIVIAQVVDRIFLLQFCGADVGAPSMILHIRCVVSVKVVQVINQMCRRVEVLLQSNYLWANFCFLWSFDMISY
jgi:hypothetical protein